MLYRRRAPAEPSALLCILLLASRLRAHPKMRPHSIALTIEYWRAACQELYSGFYRKERRWRAWAAPAVSTGKTPSAGR